MEIQVAVDVKDLSKRVADLLKYDIEETLRSKDRYTLVLSGGSTPKALYQLLATEPYRSSIPWDKIHFFWGDERFVPFEDDRNNAKMAFEELLNHVPVVKENIHIMRTDLRHEEASQHYETILHSYFTKEGETFDFVLLGMGDDGHTLSLFPKTEIIQEKEKWVSSFYLDSQSMYRISLTAPVVNKARKVVFMATGKNKAKMLQNVLEGESNVNLYPSQIIQPITGTLYWFVDQEAASEINV